MKSTKKMRELLKEGRVLLAIGAYDAFTAKIIQDLGFEFINTSGFGISASHIGKPDAGYLTLTENLSVVRNIVGSVSIPVISDVDTGYGNAINVARTVKEFESIGVAGVSIEDQIEPKRCPSSVVGPVEIISKEEMVGKIKAACDARNDPDFLILGRTDARGEEAIERARAYAEAGADMVKPTSKGFNDLDGLKRFMEGVGKPVWIIMSGWLEATHTIKDFEGTRCRVISYAGVALFSAFSAIRKALMKVRETGTTKDLLKEIPTPKEVAEFLGMSKVKEMEEKYLPR
jgi:methylisocitrate lyase